MDSHQSAVVTVDDLSYTYGSHQAVRGINFNIRRGELFALLGTNGAGKTTTLEVLHGHRRPTSGSVSVLGADPHRARRRLAEHVGVVFQEVSTPDDLTPAETLRLWFRLNGTSEVPAQSVSELLGRVDLQHRADVRIRQLSGGERRRLDLAMALATDPDLLFLDEPTAGLDPESRFRTWSVIRDQLRGGATVVLTTHYLEEAEALADRLAIMHRGRIAVAGTLSEVVSGRPSRVSVVLPAETALDSLPPFAGETTLQPDVGGRRLMLSTESLQPDLSALLSWADERGVVLHELRATEPALAEVFREVSQDVGREGE